MTQVSLYFDEGVNGNLARELFSQLQETTSCKYISAKEVVETELTSVDVFIIPGGRDLPYVKQLGEIGADKIKRFVEQGGRFLGICAGAYFGSSYVEFDKGGPLCVEGERHLKFFAGKAIGPAFGPYFYNSEKGAKILSITYKDQKRAFVSSCYYNGGCYFEKIDAANVQVLATYETGLSAIVDCHIGKGRAILSGVHFEKSLHPAAEEGRKQLMSAVLEILT